MAKDTLDADPIIVLQRFSDEVQLACPLFQRPYVWKDANIATFWADLNTVLDGEYPTRFLGALVFSQESAPTASRAGRYWVIDGQQRLTTLYLILLALADEAAQHGSDGVAFAQETFKSYLLSQRSQSKGEPRLRPTLTDTKQFQTLVLEVAQRAGIDGPEVAPHVAPGDSEGRMTAAYKTIRKHIQASIKERGVAPLETVETLRNAVLEQLEFVEIRLGSENDPNEVFDRLNNVGEKLGLVDLVRNQVLKHLDADPSKAQGVYSNDWIPFEDAFTDDAAKAKYFFPFALTLDSSATQASTFATLTEHLEAGASGEAGQRVQEMVRMLRRHQAAYNAIASGKLQVLNEPLREQVRRLVSLNRPSSVFPYVMQLITATQEGTASSHNAARCLEIIESFLVRRALRGIEPTGLHAVFKRLWGLAESDPVRVRKSIVSKTVVFPTDAEFESAIRTDDLYHRKIVRYVLEEYERATTAGDILSVFPPITVDHVMPQSYSGAWREVFTPEEHAARLHTWANLVPLSSEANSTKGASNWEEAKAKLELETVFSTTKHLYANHTTWGPADIAARADSLVAWALNRWQSYEDLLVDDLPD